LMAIEPPHPPSEDLLNRPITGIGTSISFCQLTSLTQYFRFTKRFSQDTCRKHYLSCATTISASMHCSRNLFCLTRANRHIAIKRYLFLHPFRYYFIAFTQSSSQMSQTSRNEHV
jgi:hypothetical protein